MSSDTPQRIKSAMTGMMDGARQAASDEMPPPLSQRQLLQEQLDALHAQHQQQQQALATLDEMQASIEAMKQMHQQVAQQTLQQAQRLEEQRALILKIGQIVTQTKRLIQTKEKTSWLTRWIS